MAEPGLSPDGPVSYFGVDKGTACTWTAGKSAPAHKVECLWKFQAGEIDGAARRSLGSRRGCQVVVRGLSTMSATC